MCGTHEDDIFMTQEIQQSLESIFKIIKMRIRDPRDIRGRKFPFDYMMILFIVSILNGYEDCKNTSVFLKRHEEELSNFFPEISIYGVPSHDCLNDVLVHINTEEMQKLLELHLEEFYDPSQDRLELGKISKFIRKPVTLETSNTEGIRDLSSEEIQIELHRHLSVNSYTLFSEWDKKSNRTMPYNVDFYDSDAKVTVKTGYVPDRKLEDEVNVVREMIRESDLTGSILTFDNQHSNPETIEAVAKSGGEGCFQIYQQNSPDLYAKIKKEIFDHPELVQHSTFTETSGKETVTYELYSLVDSNDAYTTFSDKISQVVFLKTTTSKVIYDANENTEREEVTEDECCFIITCILPMETLYQIIKQHWGVEATRCKMDTALEEERMTGRLGNHAFNRRVLRRIAANILQSIEYSVEVAE